MHASSYENMQKCYHRYISDSELEVRERVVVLDVGGADVNGSYRDIFSDRRFVYLIADLSAAEGVDIVIEDPNKLPLNNASVDIVISGQMLEHCEFFWVMFTEMIRVLKPDGYLFMIAPSSGPIHSYPVDCYRFYPDAYRALARYANCKLVDVWLDDRGPWRDLVGVFRHHILPNRPVGEQRHKIVNRFDPDKDRGTPEEELIVGDVNYLDVLLQLHESVKPDYYLEIGIRHGRSLSIASCKAAGIDPNPDVTTALGSQTSIFKMTSDEFFDNDSNMELIQSPDLVFIDGMHHFEFGLRDFMNVERLCKPTSLVVIDDIFPNHPAQAERERRTRVWTGDIWKLFDCLRRMRPDLLLIPLDAAPTGILLITNLDPNNRTLMENYNPLVRQYLQIEKVPEEILTRRSAVTARHPSISNLGVTLREARISPTDQGKMIKSLSQMFVKP